MNEFLVYLNQGINHILDFQGLDHLYFIISFCLLYSFKDWKPVIGLVTAFTVGHCFTLILSGLDIVSIKPSLVETLIPITILISCIHNFWCLLKKNGETTSTGFTYAILLCFGLIHGLGFSNFLKLMMFEDDSTLLALFGFNLGIEIAQLIIIFAFLILIVGAQKVRIPLTYMRLAINTIIVILIVEMLYY